MSATRIAAHLQKLILHPKVRQLGRSGFDVHHDSLAPAGVAVSSKLSRTAVPVTAPCMPNLYSLDFTLLEDSTPSEQACTQRFS